MIRDRRQLAYHIYLLGLATFAYGVPTSKFLMSLSSAFVGLGWLLHGDLKDKLKAYANNRIALLLSALFGLHLLGLLWSTDLGFAFRDIRIKLPLLIFPLVFSGMPKLKPIEVKVLLFLFIGAVIFSSFYSLGVYLEVLPTRRDISDIRNISPFISHVRFGLMISMSIMLLVYLLWTNSFKRKPIYLLAIFWLIGYLYLAQSATGFITLFTGAVFFFLYYAFTSKNVTIRAIFLVMLVGITSITFFFLRSTYNEHFRVLQDMSELSDTTVYGERYLHNYPENTVLENGYYVWSYIAPNELEKGWSMRSDLPLDTADAKGNQLEGTLIRYMTSKGLRKDLNGVQQLSDQDITNIESGIASIRSMSGGLRSRVDEILFEIDVYQNGGDPSGNSVTQRFEFWKAGRHLISENLLIGVGTGDLQIAFNHAYNELGSPLDKDHRLRAHNQYMTIMVAFGIPGAILFLIIIAAPFIWKRPYVDFYFLVFYLIIMVSFLWEDTLETQDGVTLFTFFYCLFLIAREEPQDEGRLKISV